MIILRKSYLCFLHILGTEFGITDKNSSIAYIVLYKWIDTWFLDSNRRVEVWSLPWRWHILSIPLTTGRGTSAETCGLDDVFPPDDLGSRPEALCWYIYVYIYIYMYVHSLYEFCYRSFIQRECYSVLAKLHPITFYKGVRGSWAECHFCFLWFTNRVLLFDKNLILGCLWLLVFVLNNILILSIWCSTIPHLPGCFCPWTFFENIGFNTVLTDPFMSHLTTQLGYSAGDFQALQLIVLAAFGVVD